MGTSYNFTQAGQGVQNAPINPQSQNFFAMPNGLFCNNGCDCDGELVNYISTLVLNAGLGTVNRFLQSIAFTFKGVATTVAYDGEPLDLTQPVNTAGLLAWLKSIFNAYTVGSNVAVVATVASGLVTDLVITATAESSFFVPVSLTFLSGLNVAVPTAFTVVP